MTQMHGCLARMEMNTRQREALALASRIRQAQSAQDVASSGHSRKQTTARGSSFGALLRRLLAPASAECSGTRV